jgi:Zn-finger nucleic acid-binding protein
MDQTVKLRHLIACASCHRQFDASEVAPGARFHCDCGELVTVTPPVPRDSDVVRCSSCGAPRQAGAPACTFCGSDFTLHEQDLFTLCPGCATRISNRARFCHSCAMPIEPQEMAGSSSSYACPACGADRKLHSRPLGDERMAVFECRACAGLWIDHGVFQRLEERALEREIGWDPCRPGAATQRVERPAPGAPLYRRCPVCGQFMLRTNYARRSGVIVDRCHEHGIWFDHGELAGLLQWVRNGSLTRAERQRLLENAELTAARRAAMSPPSDGELMPHQGTFARLLTELIGALIDR